MHSTYRFDDPLPSILPALCHVYIIYFMQGFSDVIPLKMLQVFDNREIEVITT